MKTKFTSLLLVTALALLFQLALAGCSKPDEQDAAGPAGPSGENREEAVTLSETSLKLAKIEVEPVEFSAMENSIDITGELRPPPDGMAVVTSRVQGKVLRLLVQEGRTVKAGEGLVLVDSMELARVDAEYHAAVSALKAARSNLDRVRDMAKMGQFSRVSLESQKDALAESRSSLEQAKAALELAEKSFQRTKELNADGIAAGKELDAARAELRKATAAEQAARTIQGNSAARLNREEEIFRKGHRSLQEVQQAEKEYRRALTDFESAGRAMEIMGVSEVNHGRNFTVTAPISGFVTSVAVTRGQAVESTTELLKIMDVKNLWLTANIYEKDLPRVHAGQDAVFSVKAYPGENFRGKLLDISPEIDESTRSVKARIEVKNPGMRLKSSMFVEGRIILGKGPRAILVPREAVQRLGEKEVVYVRKAPGQFVPRQVRPGKVRDGRQEILDGLSPGETVVTKGAFFLKAEQLKGSMETE
ncbi:MAG: efflux RND transporter periplasmic adaptor subunit [bacterium]